jgi:WD40 repeat protein
MIVLQGTKAVLDTLAFTPDGTGIAAAGSWTIRLWPNFTAKLSSPAAFGVMSPHSLHFSPDGKTLYCNSLNEQLWVWRVEERFSRTAGQKNGLGNIRSWVDPRCRYFVRSETEIGRRPPSRFVCRPVERPEETVWVVESQREVCSPPLFSPDGERFGTMEFHRNSISLSECGFGFVTRHANTGGEIGVVPLSRGTLERPALSPDGRHLVGLSTIWLFVVDVTKMYSDPVRLETGSRRHFTGLAFHLSGRFLAATSNDATVKLYDTSNWSLATTYTWDIGRMRSVAFSPDGLLAAAGSDTGKVVVWDVDV